MERRKLVEPDAKEVIFGMLDAIHCVHVEDYVHRFVCFCSSQCPRSSLCVLNLNHVDL